MSKNRELIKNTVIIFLGKISTQFLSFFLLPLYTAYLESSQYGMVDLILTYVTLIVPVLTLEIEMGTFRFLVDNRDNNQEIANIVLNSFKIILFISTTFIGIYIVIINIFKFQYCLLIGLCIFFMMMSNFLLQICRGLGKNIDYSISCFLTGISNILINIILIIFLKKSAESILIASFISNFICSIYLFIKLEILKFLKIGVKRPNLCNEIIKYSWPLVPNAISWWIINASDRTIISLFLSVGSNGIYAISTKFSSIISSFLNVFNLSWTESASLHINDQDRDIFFSAVNDTILRLFSAVCICLISFMPILFKIFIDESYIEAYKYIPINIVATFFSCIVSIYSSIYIAQKKTKQVASTSFFAAIINLLIDLILIKYIGLFAASISTAIAYITMAIYRGVDLRKCVKIKYNVLHLILILLSFTINIFVYYQSGIVYRMFNYIFAIIYLFTFNFDILNKILHKNLKK